MKKYILSAIVLVILVGGILLNRIGNVDAAIVQSGVQPVKFATSTSITLTGGVKYLLIGTSTSQNRAYATFSTQCGTPVYLRLAIATSSVSVPSDAGIPNAGGIPIMASSSYSITPNQNLYTGPVYASSTAACVVNFSEANY